MKATKKIELTDEEVKKIWDFFDVLDDIEDIVHYRSTIDIVSYLLEKWAYQQKQKGDSIIYIDDINTETSEAIKWYKEEYGDKQ